MIPLHIRKTAYMVHNKPSFAEEASSPLPRSLYVLHNKIDSILERRRRCGRGQVEPAGRPAGAGIADATAV